MGNLTRGTDCGFVTVSPTGDATASTQVIDDRAIAFKDQSPATAVKVTEMGWYCASASEEANFQIGIYTHNSGDNNPEALLAGSSGNVAKGTTAGWKVVTGLNITISPSTDYWLAVQLDNCVTITNIYFTTDAAALEDYKTGQTSLIDPWGTGTQLTRLKAIYAKWEAASGGGTNEKINIEDTWKDISAKKINIGDNWKAVAAEKINIGDNWKAIY